MRWLLAFLVLAGLWFAPSSDAMATCTPVGGNPNGANCQTVDEAYAWVASQSNWAQFNGYCPPNAPATPGEMRHTGSMTGSGAWGRGFGCGSPGNQGGFQATHTFGCPVDRPWDESTHACATPCDERPALTSGAVPFDYALGSTPAGICVDQCTYISPGTYVETFRLDGTTWTSVKGFVPINLTCSAGPDSPAPETPPTDSDGDGISDGNDSSPENPGESTTPTDPGTPPTCGGAGQPECKSSGGDKEKNTSSGGGDCNTPPTSSGDAILGQIAYQTWATRCAIAKGNGSTGAPNSTGDGKGNQAGNGDANGNGQPDWTEGGMADPADDGEDGTGHSRWGIPINSDMLDTENIFGAGSCPNLSITVKNKTFSTSEVAWWCTLVQIMRSVVLMVGAFTALRILMGE